MSSDLARDLVDSDVRYFELGARIESIAGVRLSWMPDFVDLPAGCVVLGADAGSEDAVTTLDAIEKGVIGVGGRRVRLYLDRERPALEAAMRRRGYDSRKEIGFLVEGDVRAPRSVDLVSVENPATWEIKRALHVASPDSPDGHALAPERAVELERLKSRGGAMKVWLAMSGEAVAGTVCAFDHGGILRMKNLLVHRELRRRGIATAIVAEMARMGRRAGRVLGAFAIAARPEAGLYRRPGIVAVAEWCEWLGPPLAAERVAQARS